MNLAEYLSSQKERIDQFLSRTFNEDPYIPVKLREAMAYSLMAGGKRIRPILCMAAAEAIRGDSESAVPGLALPLAAALEMIHTFSLIHDDLPAMDNDDLRRGKPTNHKVFGEGGAILAGDGLVLEAFYLLSAPSFLQSIPATVRLEIIHKIADAAGARGMVGGQRLDLEGEAKVLDEVQLQNIHRYKTGRLIEVCVTSGGKVAGATSSQIEALGKYGKAVGLAFQIADDILNVEGDRKVLGKGVGSDQTRHKATYPSAIGIEESKRRCDELVKKARHALGDFDGRADPLREIAGFITDRKY